MLDGEFYNVDTTWDDTGDGTYDYFNKTDEDYAGTISGRNFPYTCLPAMDSHTGIWSGKRRITVLEALQIWD